MSPVPHDIAVLGIGNALVDVISQEPDELLDRLGLAKGGMQLIDEARMAELYEEMGPGLETSGGSAANTMAGLASLGVDAHYVGRARDDQLGRVFAHDIRSIGVGWTQELATDGPATGCCLVLVTPDAQRTMNTFLGASALLGPEDIDERLVASAAIVYLEGYLFDRPEAQAAFRAAASAANAAGSQVALTLSDTFCVERHREAFVSLVEDHVDVLFANEAEILSLYQLDDVDEAAARAAKSTPIVVVTRSEQGAIVHSDGKVIAVPAEPVDAVVDTTGAGDQFAAGFLAGLSNGDPLERCARMGAVAAAEVISHIGPRPQTELRRLVDERLGTA